MSPQIRFIIAIRLKLVMQVRVSWEKRRLHIHAQEWEKNTQKRQRREIKFLESLRAQFSKQIRVHGSQGSAIITVRTTEGRTVHTVRRQSVQQEGGTISKEEVRTDRTVLAGTIPEADFGHLLLLIVICTVTRFPRNQAAIWLARVGS